MSRITGLLIGGILFFSSLAMAAPNLINYQGTLTNDTGAPLDGDYSMEFVIFDDELAGNMVWGESHDIVAVMNGIYNAQLGSGTLLPLSPPLSPELFAAPSLWLEVTVEGETLTPRQRLLAVPYAMTAASLAPGVVPCNPGDFVNCYSGQNGTMNIGICQSGTRTCDPLGTFGSCSGEVVPATEICNDLDDDCNGLTDDNATDATTWYADLDADGFGDINSPQTVCSQPIDYVSDTTDCLDSDNTVYPGAYEICDGLDNDCNTQIDDDCGQPRACDEAEQTIVDSCAPEYDIDPLAFADCVSPQVSATCNSALYDLGTCGFVNGCGNPVDDLACYLTNCPGLYSAYAGGPPECTFGTTRTCGTDVGECQSGIESCVYGGVWEGTCPGSIGPEEEICGNGLDDDCNGTADDIEYSWCLDIDGDGSIQTSTCTKVCAAESLPNYYRIPDYDLPSYINDCNDNDNAVHPGALEILCDAIDQNCNGFDDEGNDDPDGDGYSICSGDCAEGDNAINPDATEILCDSIDQNCNGFDDDGTLDIDEDGWTACNGDCNDADPFLNPDDNDFDTWSSCDGDCDDSDPAVNPDETEICGDSIDNDCNPATLDIVDGDADGATCDIDCNDADPALNLDDADTDSWTTCDGDCNDADPALNLDDADTDGLSTCEGDCDDADPNNYPGNTEVCDGADNNCDVLVDEVCIGQLCDDGDLCTEFDEYVDSSGSGVCTGTPKDCSYVEDQCNDATCSPGTGNCGPVPKTDGTVCDDANPNTHSDTCTAGTCGGTAYSCNDGLSCTADTPDGQGGCTYTAVGGSCFIDGACYLESQTNPANECQTCNSVMTATTWSNMTNGIACGAAAGACEYQDTCSNGTCVDNGYSPSGTMCGDSMDNACTNPDTCDGTGICQPNHEASSTVCRSATGICDITETCDGVGNCPADLVQSSSFVCRLSNGSCDIEETCDGANSSCPADVFAPEGTVCNDSVPQTYNDQCDSFGSCSGTLAICGDGSVDGNEVCDDGYTDDCGTCNADCSGSGSGSFCGDGITCPETETCDDANTDACGTCNATCDGTGTGTCGAGTGCLSNADCTSNNCNGGICE